MSTTVDSLMLTGLPSQCLRLGFSTRLKVDHKLKNCLSLRILKGLEEYRLGTGNYKVYSEVTYFSL